ncbi:LolA-related protein [Aromatoleum sp.]|uniref:LolA-related protein n=1 Tax=Aromatoleum sp. TaxID=2307007 RepID=UPI002FCC1DDA
MTRAGFFRLLLLSVLVTPGLLHAIPTLAADAWNVERLMSMLGRQAEGRATFTERKYLAVLDAPVESSGELRFRAPDRLEKITLKPRPESLVLEGDTLTVTRGERRHVVKLSDYREAAAFVDSIRATLAGDRGTLERTYALTLGGTAERWKLTLLPRDPAMAEVVSRISITGSRAQLGEIEILQADGDRSVMRIAAAALR